MIYVKMSGRLGNQMFRYAFSRWLQIKGEEPAEALVLDFSNIEKERAKQEMEGWEDSLSHFQVAPYQYYPLGKNLLWEQIGWYEKIVLGFIMAGDRLVGRKGTISRLRWRKKFLPWLNKQGLYLLFTGYDYPFSWVKGDKILQGTFECARYCEEIRDTLLEEFVPRYPVREKNKELMEKILNTNSVCITVRRGNYQLYSMLDVCTAQYFERAAERIKKLVKDPVFFVFSDEVDWVKENVKIDGEVYYETGDDPVWEKLRLMYSCRHFIIANSTFSWWAQFLGKAEDKVVIAPSRWFNGEYQPPLYEKDWYLEEVD